MPNMVYKASEHTLYENKELEILYKKVGRLLKETGIINNKEYESLNKDCDELERLLTSSIKTAKGIK